MEDVEHNCGLVVAHTLRDAYGMISRLQHRGRDATGIAAIGDERIDVIKWAGEVSKLSLKNLQKVIPDTRYHTYFAHVRYATQGRKERDQILEDAHPHVIGGETIREGRYTFIGNCDVVGVHNGQIDKTYLEEVDRKKLHTGCDTEALLHLYAQNSEGWIVRNIPGSYTLAIADRSRKEVIVLRDSRGMKPGALWKKGESYGIASEDIAARKENGTFVGDLVPGSAYYLSPSGTYRKVSLVGNSPIRHCFFEWAYVGDLEALLDGASVTTVRKKLGEALAREFPFTMDDVDYVTFLPSCPEAAAERYAEVLGIPFRSVLFKFSDERAFLGSTAQDRSESIDRNLYLDPFLRQEIRGKRLVLVDDSIVHGNNLKKAHKLLYEGAGVQSVILLSYTPPIGVFGKDKMPRGCLFGVDMPPDPAPGNEFIARDTRRNRSIEEISRIAQMQVGYLSVRAMLKAFDQSGMKPRDLCTYCIGGAHPFK